MKILQVSDFYPPAGGGMERHVQSLGHALTDRGHDLSMVTVAQRSLPSEENDRGVRVVRLPGWSRAWRRLSADPDAVFVPPAPDPGFARLLARYISELRPDLVHAHGWSVYSCLAVARAVPSSPPVVVTMHDYGHVCSRRTMQRSDGPCNTVGLARCIACGREQYGALRSGAIGVGLRAGSALIGVAKRWIAVSTSVAEVGARHLGIESVVIPSFLPDTARAELTAASARPACVPATGDYLLFVGALGEHKGFRVLLDAYGRLGRRIPLICIGARQPDTPRELPRGVRLAGKLEHAEVMAATRHAAVAITPSIWREPFGQTAVEAMLAGTPLVATAIGAFSEIIEADTTGLLVAPGDAAALAGGVARALDDQPLRSRLRELAPKHAAQFLASAVAPRIETVFEDVLKA